MAHVFVTGANGVEKSLSAADGQSLMELIRDNGFDELQALCGGSCACATCHVYVATDWVSVLGPPVGDEDDLLDSSDHRKPNSRLSCQILIGAELDGLQVTIAPMT